MFKFKELALAILGSCHSTLPCLIGIRRNCAMILMNRSPPRAPSMIAAPQLFDGTVMRGPALVAVLGGLIESVTFGDALPPGIPALPSDAILAPGFIGYQDCVSRSGIATRRRRKLSRQRITA